MQRWNENDVLLWSDKVTWKDCSQQLLPIRWRWWETPLRALQTVTCEYAHSRNFTEDVTLIMLQLLLWLECSLHKGEKARPGLSTCLKHLMKNHILLIPLCPLLHLQTGFDSDCLYMPPPVEMNIPWLSYFFFQFTFCVCIWTSTLNLSKREAMFYWQFTMCQTLCPSILITVS